MKPKHIIIFCQASLDVPYVLWLHETKKQNSFFCIFIVGVFSAYRHLTSLGLENCEITFIHVLPLRNPINILKTRIKLGKIRSGKLKNIYASEVYFFSNCYDFSTMYFLKHLRKNNDIRFIDHYLLPYTSKCKVSVLERSRQLAIFLASSMHCDFILLQRIPIFDASCYKKIAVDIWEDQAWISKYMFRLGDLDSKIALVLDSNEQACGEYNNFEIIISEMVNILFSFNYSIIVKPHPRVGYSEIYNSLPVRIVDSWMPSQFFDPSGIRVVIGLGSTGLARNYQSPHDKIRAISLLNILESFDEGLTQEEVSYLTKMSNSNVLFPRSMKDFIEIVNLP
jgi:hypothetical protein